MRNTVAKQLRKLVGPMGHKASYRRIKRSWNKIPSKDRFGALNIAIGAVAQKISEGGIQ